MWFDKTLPKSHNTNMTAKEKFVKMINWFEDLFMKNHSCICCGREILDGTKFQVCDVCKSKLSLIDGLVCKKCGEKVIDGNTFCDYCKNTNYVFDENHSYCHYDETSAKIVKGFKYGGRKYYSRGIAEMMTANVDNFKMVEVVTFVPINKARRKERGFNQAEELAKEIAKILNIEVVELLTKSDSTKHQAGLSKAERLENLKGSFVAIEENKSKIKGKVVLIVDDVFTTGATLNECSKVIKKCKPKSIVTTTFAKTKLEFKK